MPIYSYGGTATVSVCTKIEADSKEEADRMLEIGDCIWQCEDVDGDVTEIEYFGNDEE